ncbi:MAG: hypothetical protein SNG49_02415 [Rikenellaceae bacterium]
MEQKCAEGEQIADLQNKYIPVIPDSIWDLQERVDLTQLCRLIL